MSLQDRIEGAVIWGVDRVMDRVHRRASAPANVHDAKVIAHRGAHVGKFGPIPENTLAAFETAVNGGCWGLEFDVRWTKDDVAVIHHDPSCERVHRNGCVIRETPFSALRRELAMIPTLEEVVHQFRTRAHLMIEIKRPESEWNPERVRIFARLLQGLSPIVDYHVMGMNVDLLRRIAQHSEIPRKALLPVGFHTVAPFSRIALQEDMAGVAGHYLLVTDAITRRHHDAGQKVGTGFIASKALLYHETSRGIDWLFSNHGPQMAAIARGDVSGARP